MSITETLCSRLIEDLSKPTIDYEKAVKAYCTLTVPRNIFLSRYKTLPPIETIPNEEKIQWRLFVNEAFPNTTPQFRLDAIKILYCIGTLTN